MKFDSLTFVTGLLVFLAVVVSIAGLVWVFTISPLLGLVSVVFLIIVAAVVFISRR